MCDPTQNPRRLRRPLRPARGDCVMRLTPHDSMVGSPCSTPCGSGAKRFTELVSDDLPFSSPIQFKDPATALAPLRGASTLDGQHFPKSNRVASRHRLDGLRVKWWSRGLSAGLIKRGPVNSRTPCQISDMRPAQAEVNHRASDTIKAKRPTDGACAMSKRVSKQIRDSLVLAHSLRCLQHEL